MSSQAKRQRPQTKTVDELINELDTLLRQVRQPKHPIAKRSLQLQIVEAQTELLERQRERNRRDTATGRNEKTMANTPLPPQTVQSTPPPVNLAAMR